MFTARNLLAEISQYSSSSPSGSSGLSEMLEEGDLEQRAQRANTALARAFENGQGLDAALQAAARADAAEAEQALKLERRRWVHVPEEY